MILVTGGTGFLGARLIKYLIDDGKAVVATKRHNSVIPENLRTSSLIQWIEADITDYFALSDLFPGISKVYHCAAMVSYQKENWAQMLHTNIEGTKHIVNLCLQHGVRLLHVSSIAALGSSKAGEPVDEQSKWDDGAKRSKYADSKYESEMDVWRGIAEGLDAVIVNPSVIMGSGTGAKGSGMIFDTVQRGLKFYPPGSVGIVDVEDVAQIMILLMNRKDISGERFVLNSQNISNKNLLEHISRFLGKAKPSIAASPLMLSVAWRCAKFLSKLTGKAPALTRETAKASASKLAYANDKITRTTGYSFKPISRTLEEMSKEFAKQA